MNTWLQVLVPAMGGGGLIGGLVLLLKAKSENKKLQAEAKKTDFEGGRVGVDGAVALTAATLTLIEPFRAQVKELSERCTTAETAVRHLTRQVNELSDRVQDLQQDLEIAHRTLVKNGIPVPPQDVTTT